MTQPRQRWDPDRYARNARFVADLGAPLIDLLAPRPGESILDLGCGDGALTAEIAARGASVVGVDSSPEQIAAARARGLDARVADGHALDFVEAFDAILTNAALHWMRRPEAVIDGMWRALRPGGRVVGEMGAKGNVAAITAAIAEAMARRGLDIEAVFPWYFPDTEAYAGLLAAAGFVVEDIESFARPTPLPGDIADWLETFGEPFLFAVPDDARPAFVAEVRAALKPLLFSPETGWVADYVRLRFRAVKPTRRDR